MPAMPLPELYNGLVTGAERRPRILGSSCQAVPIAPFAPKQSPFSARDVSRAWKDYSESPLKSWCLGWVHDQCYWPFLDQIFIKQAQGIFSSTPSNWATRIVVGCSAVVAWLFMASVCINKLKNNFFKEMGECLQQDKSFTGPGVLITFRRVWKYHRPCW